MRLLLACLILTGQAFCIDPQTPRGGLLFNADLKSPLGDLGVENTIKIGLLIQDNKSIEARNGAELAVLIANREGGFNGIRFELVVRSMEGPWGAGSKQAVDLIFTEKVLAIVGSHDGRNAHLVEQATTKANITFLSAWSGDPTLSQAFTPWFFNSVPNNNQQADMLIEEINRKKFRKIAVVTDDDYDATSAFKSFVRKTDEKGNIRPVVIKTDKREKDFSGTAGIISRMNPDCLLLFTRPVTAGKIISGLTEMKIELPVYGPLSLLGESSPLYRNPGMHANLLLLSSGDWYLPQKSEFSVLYHDKFGSHPGATAAYAFDAMMVMINAVKAAGADKEKVQKAMMETDYSGATGKIKFDEKGNRINTVVRTK